MLLGLAASDASHLSTTVDLVVVGRLVRGGRVEARVVVRRDVVDCEVVEIGG